MKRNCLCFCPSSTAIGRRDKGVRPWPVRHLPPIQCCPIAAHPPVGNRPSGGRLQAVRSNPAVDPVRFALWTLRDEAAQRRSPPR
jgi:hypothetical protein